jgi:hypothetical protein
VTSNARRCVRLRSWVGQQQLEGPVGGHRPGSHRCPPRALHRALGAPFVNVKRQRRRLLFYAYYPAHLAALWTLRSFLGTDKASNARAFPWALHSAASAALFLASDT